MMVYIVKGETGNFFLTLQVSTKQNGQTHRNNLSAVNRRIV